MGRRSQEEELTEALADMPKWQRKTARSLLGYGVIIAILALVSLAEPWIFWHKIVKYSSTNPLKALQLLVLPVAVGGLSIFVILPMLLNSAQTMLRSAREEERRRAAEPEEVMLQ